MHAFRSSPPSALSPSAAPKSNTTASDAPLIHAAEPTPSEASESTTKGRRIKEASLRNDRGAEGDEKRKGVEATLAASERAVSHPSSSASASSSSSSRSRSPATVDDALQPLKDKAALHERGMGKDYGEDVSISGDTRSSGSTKRLRLSAHPTFSTISSSGTVATSTSSLSVKIAAVPRTVPHATPALSATMVALPSDASPPPPLIEQQQQQQQQQQTEKALGETGGDVPAPPPRAFPKGPTVLSLMSTYKSVPVLPPQVFRSTSSTATSLSPGAGGGGGGGGGVSVNSATSTPVLSPPQQSWVHPAGLAAVNTAATAAAATATAGQLSPPLRASALPRNPSSTGITTPMSSMAGPVATASSPTHLPIRVAYSMGGSRKRNSVSVPTHLNLASEDEDNVNAYVVDEACPSAEQWLLLSQSTSNIANNTMISTAVTSRSSSRDHAAPFTALLAEEATDTPATVLMPAGSVNTHPNAFRIGSSAANATYQPPSTWSLLKPQVATDPRAATYALRSPQPTSAAAAPSQPSSHTPSNFPVPDPPPMTAPYGPPSVANSDTANTSLQSPSVYPSRDHSLALSFRSPLHSPSTMASAGGAHGSGGRGAAGLSRRNSLGSLRLATHDPYNATVMSPVVGPRTASLSSLRSPSATLTSPTAPPSAMLPPPSAAETSRQQHNNNNNNQQQQQHVHHHYHQQPEHFLYADNSTQPLAGQSAEDWPQQQQQQSRVFSSSATSQLVSPLGHGGHSGLTSPFPHSPQTTTPLAAPMHTAAPQQQQPQQQHQLPFLFAAAQPPPPRRRSAREALTGFFSEVPIELGDQTHLVLDRNGVPYQDGVPGPYTGGGSSSSHNTDLLPPPPPPPSAYPAMPAAHAYNSSTDSTQRGTASAASYAAYMPPPPPPPQQQHQQRQQVTTITSNSGTPMMYHGPSAHGTVPDRAAPPYSCDDGYRQAINNGTYAPMRGGAGAQQFTTTPASAMGTGNSVYCTSLDSRSLRAAAYGDRASATSMSQLYPMDDTMYDATVDPVSDRSFAGNSRGRGSGGVSRAQDAHTQRSASPGEGYGYGFSTTLPGSYNEAETQMATRGPSSTSSLPPPGRVGGESHLPTYPPPPPQHRVGAIFAAPLSRSTGVRESAGGCPPASTEDCIRPFHTNGGSQPHSGAMSRAVDVYGGPVPYASHGQRMPPPPPPPPLQHQQQQYQQQQRNSLLSLNYASDSVPSYYPCAPATTGEGSEPKWSGVPGGSGDGMRSEASSRMYDVDSGIHSAVNTTLRRGGRR